MSEEYKTIKDTELKNTHSDFSFSEEMQNASRNEMWKKKNGLWMIISGACDDAVRQCYEKINLLSDELTDVDTCNVHALKSIAKSVDLAYLCKNIKEDFPLDIANLIDLFSVPKHILLHSNRILHPDSNAALEGSIVDRSSQIINDGRGYSIDLLYEIKKHISDIREILNRNMIFTKRRLYKYDKELGRISTESLISQEYYDYVASIYKEYNEQFEDKLSFETQIYKTADDFIGYISKIDFQQIKNYQNDVIVDNGLNPFFVIINVCKYNLRNKEYDFFIVPSYFNDQRNIEVNLTQLFTNIINSFETFDEVYVEDFICYHFYNTIVSKIKNSYLANYFDFIKASNKISENVSENNYHFVLRNNGLNEFTEEEFHEQLLQFITSDEADEFINQRYPKVNIHTEKDEYSINDTDFFNDSDEFKVKINQNMNKHMIDFVKYVKFINSALNNSREYISGALSIDLPEKIDYDILKINFSSCVPYQKEIRINDENTYVNNYDLILFGDNEHEGVIKRIAKELTDITINISHIREQIKTSIQQYSFIGTKRIATDILRDFFIKNYSKKDEWNYISDLLSEGNVDISALFKPLSELLNADSKFSIDVVEYYDSTNYLNIESDLPNVKIDTVLKGFEERPSYWIDDHNLITSGLVSTAVYEDIYGPCAIYANDYNKKFWRSVGTVITPSGVVNENYSFKAPASDYDTMFGQYFDELKNTDNENEKNSIISNMMIPLFERIWDTFALSALNDNPEALGELAGIYRKYLGTSEGTDRYANEHNKIFPTIAPLATLENLVEVKNHVDDILFVAKVYYANVLPSIISATKEMLKMHDKNGIPYEGWRQNYINYHGYSTSYEYAKNMSVKEDEPDKKFEFDGPFSYSTMQKIVYENFMNEDTDEKISGSIISSSIISSIVKYIDVSNSAMFINAYDSYFNHKTAEMISKTFNGSDYEDENSEVSLPMYFSPKAEDFIGNYNIEKIEKDVYENTYTLFKKTDKVDGKLFFRSNDMLLSLPIMQEYLTVDDVDFIRNKNYSTNANIEIIRKMVKGCVDFGVIGNFMWMFSKIDDDLNKDLYIYKFVSFKFIDDDHHLIVDEDSLRFYSNTPNAAGNRISYLNNYIGSVYEPNKEYVDFLFSDWEEILKSASMKGDEIKEEYELSDGENKEAQICEIGRDYIFNGVTIPIYKIRLNVLENKYDTMNIDVKNCAMPMLIDHFKFVNSNEINSSAQSEQSAENNSKAFSETDHHIWKIDKYNGKCLICYEALNENYENYSDLYYYFGFGKLMFKYQVLEICFNNSNFYTNRNYNDKTNMEYANNISFILYDEEEFVKSDAIFDKLLNLCYEYPKCIIRNGNLIVKILPFALTSYGSIEKQKIFANSIARNIYNANFKNAQDEADDDKTDIHIEFKDTYEKFNLYFKNAEAEKGVINTSLSSLQFINDIIYNEQNDLMISPLSSIEETNNSIQMSSSFEFANRIFERIPFVTKCMPEKLKITVWFKNDTGITFIDDRALDLDLTCYIDDPFEKDNKVGYWNPYVGTRYIEWTGDRNNEDHEELLIDINKYVKERKPKNDIKINLNLCWHDSSQIKSPEVYVMINWQNVVENVPISIVGDTNKNCETRSLSILIHPNRNNVLTYEIPKWYPVFKVAYKEQIVAYEDGIPDIQLGFANLTESELKKIQNEWFSVNYYDIGREDEVKFSAFRHKIKKFKRSDKEIDYVSYLINEPLAGDLYDPDLNRKIVEILADHFGIMSTRLNYVTKERFFYVTYTKLCIDEIFFGPKIKNEDPETGINMIYYSFFNPTYFKDSDTQNNYAFPIEAAMKDLRMNYNVGYDNYWTSDAISGLVSILKFALANDIIVGYDDIDATNAFGQYSSTYSSSIIADEKEMIDRYLHDTDATDYSIAGFFKYAWHELGNPEEHLSANYVGAASVLFDYLKNELTNMGVIRYYPSYLLEEFAKNKVKE